MKARITQMEPLSTTIDALKKVVQDLWDEMDPCDCIKGFQKMPEKYWEVVKQKSGQNALLTNNLSMYSMATR